MSCPSPYPAHGVGRIPWALPPKGTHLDKEGLVLGHTSLEIRPLLFSTLRQKSQWSARLTQKLPRYSAEDQCSCFWVPIPLKKILGFLLVNMRWTDTPSSSVSAFSTPFCPHWEEKHEALACLVI